MNKKDNKCGPSRCEILGFILILIATLLTIFTFNGLGILGMFIVGMALCCHKGLCGKNMHCHDEGDEHCTTTTKTRAKKS